MKPVIKRNAQGGFTLIELIVVIVILGILAATALPKFANLGADARVASLNAAKGALAATAAMAHGKYLVNPSASSFTAEGATVTFATTVASGYPKADAGLLAAAGLDADYTTILPSQGATTTAPGTSATEVIAVPKSVAGTPTALTCYVKYTEATSTTGTPTITVYGTNTSGC